MSVNTDAVTVKQIPIKNLWLLMLYASQLYKEIFHDINKTKKRIKAEENPDYMPNLIAEILTREIKIRLQRNLSLELHRRHAILTRVRGKINHIHTERRYLLQQGKISCSFDEFTVDTPPNRLIRAALDVLSRIVDDNDLKIQCRAYKAAFEKNGVSSNYHNTQLHIRMLADYAKKNPADTIMLAAAKLALDMRIPTEESGNLSMITPNRENQNWMRKLFEKAIGGFYKAVLSLEWSVYQGKWFEWQTESPTAKISEILPKMQTDIILERSKSNTGKAMRIIIDTKYTSILKPSRYNDKEEESKYKIESKYIYQIYAYLRSQEKDDDTLSKTTAGILLYPSIGIDYDESVTIQGHQIRFATIDLAQDSHYIRKRLLKIIADYD